jgi:CheY-like chemotaxis protein/HPt (histidine-containing phosphotransfer) domain-containing protein
MLRQRLSPQQQRYAELIRHSARSLLEIINDILDFSKLEAGKLRLEERDFDLREMVEGLRRVVAFECERKGLELRCEVREDLPRRLRGDDFRLRQVLSNLLGNAVKFTDHGSVVLRVERDPEERAAAGRVVLRFIVADTGGGIPRDKLERIFESFTQLDSSPAKRHEGSGLGLAISRQLAVMLGGDIRVRSEPGRGSEFTLRARLRTAESAQERPAEDTRARTCREGRGLRVLLAEDNTVNRTFMHDVLATAGHSVVSAGDGQAVLNALRGQRFDVVLMDVQMPGMDGLEATRRIRGGQERGVDPHVPVVAVTAFALESDRERIMAAGMDGYLAKPLGADELLRAVCDAAQGRQAEQAVPAPETAAPTDEPGAVLDRAGALQRCNGNRRLLAKLERVFVEDAPAACEELEQALEQGDLSRARGLAHALKNSAGMVGAVVLQDAARAVEAAARQGDTAGARACREPLAAALARTMERIGIDPEEC